MLRSTVDEDLYKLVNASMDDGQPILHHLNADTTWLLQLPVPRSSSPSPSPPPSTLSSASPTNRAYFNIILDPWLSGPQSDLASWFSRQWHAISSAYQTVEEVSELCRRVEAIARPDQRAADSSTAMIDAIAISHEFTDHCHEDTLVQFGRDVPVIATTKAAELIRGWGHFERVIETPPFGGAAGVDKDGQPRAGADWRSTPIDALPRWLSISRVVTGQDAFYYHSAILFAFQLDGDGDGDGGGGNALGRAQNKEKRNSRPAQCVIYTPHGIRANSLSSISTAQPRLQTLAMLHGLHDIRIDWGQQLNLGAHNGLKAQRALRARYWLGTHDEVKKGGGIVSWFLRRKVWSVADALDSARDEEGKGLFGGEYLELGNGRALVLTMRGAEEVDEVNGVEDEL